MAEDEESGARREYGLDRILALSDGVFAFAITLLVLDLAVPNLARGASTQDITFSIISRATNVRQLLRQLSRHRALVDYPSPKLQPHKRYGFSILGWLNLFFLLWIALTPFFTKLLDTYGYIQLPVVLYALVQAAAGGFMTLIWWYASRNHRLIARNLKDTTIRYALTANSVAPTVFLLSVGLSFIVPPYTVRYSWLLIIPPLILLTSTPKKGKL